MALLWTPGPFRWAFRWRPLGAGSSPTFLLWARPARKLLEIRVRERRPPHPRPTRRAARSAQVPGAGSGRSGLTGGDGRGAGGRCEAARVWEAQADLAGARLARRWSRRVTSCAGGADRPSLTRGP